MKIRKIFASKTFYFLLSLLISCFLFFAFVFPVWADCAYVCCPPDRCRTRHPESPPYVCEPDALCCTACTGVGGVSLGILKGLGPLGLEDLSEITREAVLNRFSDLISTIIGFMTVIAGIWFLFLVIIAGYQWLSSGGDKAGVTAAREKLTYAIIGLVIVVAAFAIVSIIGTLMGIKFLQPGETLKNFPVIGD